MGMSVGTTRGSAGRGRRRRGGGQPMSEINVTPFVDVMLVLLVIFMVSAPLLTSGVPIDLPETQAKTLNPDTKPITISVDPEGKIFLQEDEVVFADLVGAVSALAEAGAGFEERILLRGDRGASHGVIMKVLGAINGAGYTKIGLVALSENGS